MIIKIDVVRDEGSARRGLRLTKVHHENDTEKDIPPPPTPTRHEALKSRLEMVEGKLQGPILESAEGEEEFILDSSDKNLQGNCEGIFPLFIIRPLDYQGPKHRPMITRVRR